MPKKETQINIRVSEQEKELIVKTGYKPYEIIKMFLDKYYNTTPVGLTIELDSLKKEKKEMVNKQIYMDNKINEIENKLSNYNDLDLIPDTAISLIKIAIIKYLNKSIQYHSISEFLDENTELVNIQANKTGYEPLKYKKLVIEYYNKHYD